MICNLANQNENNNIDGGFKGSPLIENNIDDVVKGSPLKERIYRFKFSNNIVELLIYFAKLHEFDNRNDFKEAWKKWYELNKDELEREEQHIINLGYTGNVEEKMYKAARYYFRKKETKSEDIQDKDIQDKDIQDKDIQDKDILTKTNKKRQYILLTQDILIAMDNHIKSNINNDNYKPATGFDDFCKTNKILVATESLGLKKYNLKKDAISCKIKKTYKNRYYLIAKQNNSELS